MAATFHIRLGRNEDYLKDWALTDDDGAPLDLTGWTLELDIKERLATSIVQSADLMVTDAVNGVLGVYIPGGPMAPISLIGNALQDIALVYDLRGTDVDGFRTVFVRGTLTMIRGVVL